MGFFDKKDYTDRREDDRRIVILETLLENQQSKITELVERDNTLFNKLEESIDKILLSMNLIREDNHKTLVFMEEKVKDDLDKNFLGKLQYEVDKRSNKDGLDKIVQESQKRITKQVTYLITGFIAALTICAWIYSNFIAG